MIPSTTADSDPAPTMASTKAKGFSFRVLVPTLLVLGVAVILLAIAVGMRLYNLGLPFDRDSYDEGVYWQSLRAMSAGHALYQQTFYSQPPFFLLSTYPFFILFGSTIWSARLGVALISLLGMVGAFLIGKALGGRVGAIAALLLLVAEPFYLAQSQTLQAEASSVAFGLLAVGLAYLWWEHPNGARGLWLAALTGVTLSLSILCKFLGFACAVPIILLMLARLWQIWRQPRETRLVSLRPILIGSATCLLTFVLIFLPFLGSFSQLWQDMITFHTDAAALLKNSPDGQAGNFPKIQTFLTSVFALAALIGTLAALLRRDWRVLPLVAWLLVTIYLLNQQVPLFHHHLVALIPPLLALTVVGIGPLPTFATLKKQLFPILTYIATGITLIMLALVIVFNVPTIQHYYQSNIRHGTDSLAQQAQLVARQLQSVITPDELMITDSQFVAGLADRSTPPLLVDTSSVRLETRFITLVQLESEIALPQVHAVLLFSGRLSVGDGVNPQQWDRDLHAWLMAHSYRLLYTYGLDGIGQRKELWVR